MDNVLCNDAKIILNYSLIRWHIDNVNFPGSEDFREILYVTRPYMLLSVMDAVIICNLSTLK
jgi:hypothetical protein